MLVLSRKVGQRIVVGDDVCIIVNRISGNRVSIAVEAPQHMKVLRGELHPIRSENETERQASNHAIPVSVIGDVAELYCFDSPRLAR